MTDFLQFLISGLQVGAIYALVALGFTLIYNASHVVNFAQGEFVMLGAMLSFFIAAAGLPMGLAIIVAMLVTALLGALLYFGAIATARTNDVVSLIIITIGASIFFRGLASVVFGKSAVRAESFSGDEPFSLFGALVLPQVLWIIAGAGVVFFVLWVILSRSLTGKAVLAVSNDPIAAKLVGINTGMIVGLSFAFSAAAGALAGALMSPITTADYKMGTLLALKGFTAAMLGGIGVPAGALLGGLALGLIEQMTASYISSAYKDAMGFIVLLLIIGFKPAGLLGRASLERV